MTLIPVSRMLTAERKNEIKLTVKIVIVITTVSIAQT
jgi:hypothetical protein